MRNALLFCALLAGCIERPFNAPPAAAPRATVDRAALQGVLIAALPDGVVPVGAVFGSAAELVGYKLEPPALVPGRQARLTLFWRCLAPLEAWHIFVHLDEPDGARIHAEHDPANGRFPTDAWKPGDLVADPVAFEPHTNPLLLYLGFFSQGEARLPLTQAGRGRDDGNNRLFVGALPISH